MNIVFDTNIYIAAFLKRGHLFDLLKTVLNRKSGFFLYYSEEIINELRNRLEGEEVFRSEDIQSFVSILHRNAHRAQSREKIEQIKEDPDDDRILECAVAAEANLIISMDRHLLKLKTFRNIPIVHPNTFQYMMPGR